tara:strand:- start:5099 stop:5353 length:255 start_codon:yes stop_codon:yes gene_type:complete
MSKLYLGEKIETIILSRKSGKFGKYLGSTKNFFGSVDILGCIYHVERNVEIDENKPWFWRVKNVNTGNVIRLAEPDDLALQKFI